MSDDVYAAARGLWLTYKLSSRAERGTSQQQVAVAISNLRDQRQQDPLGKM